MSQTFSQFCKDLGLPLKNRRWSWCAINEERRQAVFTIWDDRLAHPKRDTIDLSWLDAASQTEKGAKEFRRAISRVINDGFDAYGIRCEAKDINAAPRSRKRFDHELLVLKVVVENDRTIARITGKVDASVVSQNASVVDEMDIARSAIDDLDAEAVGNIAPGKLRAVGAFFARDDAVRKRVVKRAKGKCEYCGCAGFTKSDGAFYIEAHHIISLAEQGPDTLDNVIALCANHHRQAHYGADRIELERDFKKILCDLRRR